MTVLGNPLRASHIATVTGVFTDLDVHANHIRRLARRPTTIQFYVSGSDINVLRPALARAADEWSRHLADPAHPIYGTLFDLQSIDAVRTIEGR